MNLSKSFNQSFKLSNKGKLASAVSMAVVLPWISVSASAAGINPVGETSVSQVNSIDVVNIANPNALGLSHNQYKDFNVSQAGAVLNNSMSSGQSVLAGELGANSNLTQNAASVILNEVVSKNPSLLLGQQEVFGMAADYVLANPNGITSSGGGFINTNRASLVVGTPNITEDRLSSFNVGNRSKTLTVNGDLDGNKRLDLLAPKVDINGNITASDEINVISGRNEVAYDDLSLSELTGFTPLRVLDGSVVGSMQSGRIRLHNTDEGATQTLQGSLQATDSVSVSADNLDITASDITANSVDLAANDHLSIGGTIESHHVDADETNEKLALRVKLTNTGYNDTEVFNGSTIDANTIEVSGNDVEILGSQLIGADLSATGENITVDGVITTGINSETARRSKFLWFNEDEVLDSTEQYHESRLSASKSIDLNATNDLTINGASIGQSSETDSVNNTDITLTAGKNLLIGAGTSVTSHSDINRYKNETSKLKSGDHTVTQTVETIHKANINGDDVVLKSSGVQEVQGADITANSVNLSSENDLTIGHSSTNATQDNEEVYTYWGGLSGGEDHIDNTSQNVLVGTNINADSIALSSNKDVNIIASKVTTTDDLTIDAANTVNVTSGFSTESDFRKDKVGKALNIADGPTTTIEREATHTVESNLQGENVSISGDSVNVIGSQLAASNVLDVNAITGLTTDVANATDITTVKTKDTETESDASTGLLSEGKLSDRLSISASGGIKGLTTTTKTGTGSATANKLTANNVSLTAQDINLKGSQIASNGSLNISGDEVTVASGEALTAINTKEVNSTGPEASISASLAGIHIGLGIVTDHAVDEHHEYAAINSSLDSEKDVSINAIGQLTTKGATIEAENIALSGENVTNEASHSRVVDRSVVGGGEGSLTFATSLTNLVDANGGLSGDGAGTITEVKTASTTNFKATDTVEITAEQQAIDAGTQISAASIDIKADDYTGTAAYDSTVTTTNIGMGATNLGVQSALLTSIDVSTGGEGDYQYLQVGDAQAIKGSLSADSVDVDVTNDANVAQNVTAKTYHIKADNTAQMGQDSDKQWKTAGGFNIDDSVGLNIIPAAAAAGVIGTPAIALDNGFNVLVIKDAQAKVADVTVDSLTVESDNLAQIEGAKITADSITLQGTQANILAAQDTHSAVGVDLGGNAAFTLDIADALTGSEGIGLGGALGVVNEKSNKAHSAVIDTGSLTVTASDADKALTVEGAHINADTIALTNTGAVNVVAAESKDYVGNFAIGGGLSTVTDSTAVDPNNAHLAIETDNSTYYTLGDLTAMQMDIDSGKDVTLQSNIVVDTLAVDTDGELNVASAQDTVLKVDVDLAGSIDGIPSTADIISSLSGLGNGSSLTDFDLASLLGGLGNGSSLTDFDLASLLGGLDTGFSVVDVNTDASLDNVDVSTALGDFDAASLLGTIDFDTLLSNIIPKSLTDGNVLGVNAKAKVGLDVDNQQFTQHATVDVDTLNTKVGSQKVNVNAATVIADSSNLSGVNITTSDNDDYVHAFKVALDTETLDVDIPKIVTGLVSGEDFGSLIGVDYVWDDTDGDNTRADVSSL